MTIQMLPHLTTIHIPKKKSDKVIENEETFYSHIVEMGGESKEVDNM